MTSKATEDVEPPTKGLRDILAFEHVPKSHPNPSKRPPISSVHNPPNEILGGWLYLGNHMHAKSKDVIDALQITHILNVTSFAINGVSQYIHSLF